MTDRSALVRWKERLRVPLDADDREFLRRFGKWRSLWIFNRKRRGKGRSG